MQFVFSESVLFSCCVGSKGPQQTTLANANISIFCFQLKHFNWTNYSTYSASMDVRLPCHTLSRPVYWYLFNLPFFQKCQVSKISGLSAHCSWKSQKINHKKSFWNNKFLSTLTWISQIMYNRWISVILNLLKKTCVPLQLYLGFAMSQPRLLYKKLIENCSTFVPPQHRGLYIRLHQCCRHMCHKLVNGCNKISFKNEGNTSKWEKHGKYGALRKYLLSFHFSCFYIMYPIFCQMSQNKPKCWIFPLTYINVSVLQYKEISYVLSVLLVLSL